MTHGSLFDGAGLLRMGFEQAGIETKWTLELMNGQDITKENPSAYPRVGIISGGPPCQATSRAASFSGRKTNESLWPQMLRFVSALKSDWVLVEQPEVDKEWILSVVQDLQQCGYGVAGRVIDSKHWVPQQRTRWFVVGRMGITGLALGDYLYSSGERMEGIREGIQGRKFLGNCPDCLRGGVFARNVDRKPALMGAGNGVTVPVAKWLAERILAAEAQIKGAK